MNNSELIPVSALNTYVYCSRRFYLEHNRGMFEDNPHTIEGRTAHRVVDDRSKEGKEINKNDVIHRRSVYFSSENFGIIGKLDLLEEKENEIYPVEYKKGKAPNKNYAPWLNDQIQLCAQALLMQENGLKLPDKAYLYYVGSKKRVEIQITENLILETHRVIAACRLIAKSDVLPPLAENRNKCFGCSLNAICLPEEEETLKGKKINAKVIIPMSLDGDILYVDHIGAYVSLSDGNIKITKPESDDIVTASLEKVREIIICGPVQATTQVIHECLKKNIPIHYMNFHGKQLGVSTPFFNYHGILREAQWKAHFDDKICLDLAKITVSSKMANMKTLMMRYTRDERTEDDVDFFDKIKNLNKKIDPVKDMDSLRGYEGMAARIYFECFERYIKLDKRAFFYFKERNRRPPKDPVNALLSFGYSMLVKDCIGAAIRVGFDPFCGYYHSMKYGRPSLSLDVMEFFRQPIVDSVVLSSINNGIFKDKDFHQYQGVCYLNEKGRKKFLIQYEMRKKDLVTHPKFHYRMSYERTIELQYRLLGKFLLNDIDEYQGFYIR
ncbi:MAG: CRISPR-associated endonuclease Cas1 [Desulfobacterales bacterium]|nr:CRISPR-associated endonuclease Cas1 [Desulfobacterales bacterium]